MGVLEAEVELLRVLPLVVVAVVFVFSWRFMSVGRLAGVKLAWPAPRPAAACWASAPKFSEPRGCAWGAPAAAAAANR